MHFHQKSANQLSNSITALMLILITYSTSCDASLGLTVDDIADALALANLDLETSNVTTKFCGAKLNNAMKTYCIPTIRKRILEEGEKIKLDQKAQRVQKKSMDQSELDFEQFDGGYDDDVMSGPQYRTTLDDLFQTNVIPAIFPSQANRRRRRGIIDLCCRNPCYKHELVLFCPTKTG